MVCGGPGECIPSPSSLMHIDGRLPCAITRDGLPSGSHRLAHVAVGAVVHDASRKRGVADIVARQSPLDVHFGLIHIEF